MNYKCLKIKIFYTIIISIILIQTACTETLRKDNDLPNEEINKLIEDSKPLMFNKPDSAILLLSQVLNQDKSKLTSKQITDAYTQTGIAYSIKNELATSDSIYMECLKVLETKEDSISRSSIYINLGINSSKQGKTKDAIAFYKKAEEIAVKYEKGDENIDRINNNIGLAYNSIGKLDSARYYYQKALDAAVNKKDNGSEANTLLNLSTVLYNLKEYSQAEQNLRRANELYREVDNKNGMIKSFTNLAVTLTAQKKYDDALKSYKNAEELALLTGLSSRLGSIYHNMGEIYLEKKDYENSLKLLDESLNIKEQLKDSIGIARSYNAKSAIYSRIKEYEKAETYANEAFKIAEKAQLYDLKMYIYTNLSSIKAGQGQWDEAMKNIDARDVLKDSLFSKQKFEAIQELQTKYETERKEQELISAKETIKQHRIVTILLIVICLSIVICFIITYYYQRKKIQNHIRIIKQDEELSKHINKTLGQDIATIDNDKANDILPKLNLLFSEEKIYRTQGLNINMVAQQLGTNRDYLSKAINSHLQKGFNEYINYFRVEEAKEILKKQNKGESLNYTMLTIAEEVGFTGTSTFYTAFKQAVGLTPSEYKKTLKHIKEG